MKLNTIVLSFTLLVIFGCKQQEHKKENVTNSNTEIIQVEKIPDNLVDWLHAINSANIDALQNSYHANAIKIISADSILSGAPQIANSYNSHKNKIISIESLFSVEASKEKGITYELVKYKTITHKEYIQLVIWSMENEKVIREFEFTETTNTTSANVDITDIDDRRNLWIERCNANNAENLVKQLYSSNTMYFNHKPLVRGTEDLIAEYDYMNDKNYSLNLQPLKLAIVNANFVFEIGQCSGSYNGKYILIWKKHTDGNWYIYIDSNI
ncbi:hypothetical protein [Kordia sp.]|uniref:hypothetical protein n=1 Tax=Kordia sp. TaxID=1965332 RepID=UPI003D2C5181